LIQYLYKYQNSIAISSIRFSLYIYKIEFYFLVSSKKRQTVYSLKILLKNFSTTVENILFLNQFFVIDNISFYYSEKLEQIYFDKEIKLIYLSLYLPDLNPIEEFFAELKVFIRRNWQYYAENPDQEFDYFLDWYIDKVGAKKQNARDHFINADIDIEDIQRKS